MAESTQSQEDPWAKDFIKMGDILTEQLMTRDFKVEIIRGDAINKFSHFAKINSQHAEDQKTFIDYACRKIQGERAIGAMVGMALGDCCGHPFEFLDVVDEPTTYVYDIRKNTYTQENNQFGLERGQWTDDASMGLCIADSLIMEKKYDGSDIRVRFYNWWVNGFDNAFRNETDRIRSVGLGGNISKSIRDVGRIQGSNKKPSARFESSGQDSGNGSLMRLAPIPIFFCFDEQKAREFARESSYTTHPGPIAAEACAFMATVIIRAMHRRENVDIRTWLDALVQDYIETILPTCSQKTDDEKEAVMYMKKLLLSNESASSTEVNWNWRAAKLLPERACANRGSNYNGYPVSPGYFGAYSMDGLAIALYCLYNTNNFHDAVQRCINFCGDADSTGSICGQMAGAFYGYKTIHSSLVDMLRRWDDGNFALRGALLLQMALKQEADQK